MNKLGVTQLGELSLDLPSWATEPDYFRGDPSWEFVIDTPDLIVVQYKPDPRTTNYLYEWLIWYA